MDMRTLMNKVKLIENFKKNILMEDNNGDGTGGVDSGNTPVTSRRFGSGGDTFTQGGMEDMDNDSGTISPGGTRKSTASVEGVDEDYSGTSDSGEQLTFPGNAPSDSHTGTSDSGESLTFSGPDPENAYHTGTSDTGEELTFPGKGSPNIESIDMRTLMNKVKLAEDTNFKKDILKTFRKKLSESHNVKLSATRTAKTFGIDVKDVVFIVREAKEKVMEDMPGYQGANDPNAPRSDSTEEGDPGRDDGGMTTTNEADESVDEDYAGGVGVPVGHADPNATSSATAMGDEGGTGTTNSSTAEPENPSPLQNFSVSTQ